ncbi:hypothetical protein DTO012A7_9576 [Penicillium roqueforti]|nr:hypothetical protein DTO012A7_9576 [Penicillium roqueforti]
MLDDTEVIIHRHYCPPEVKKVIASGSSAFIGEVDDLTVMKLPLAPGGDMRFRGFSDKGLYLERAVNGTLGYYLLESDNAPPSIQQQLSWCREATEAVAWIHAQGIIHYNIQPGNILLDEDLHIKLSDFQGKQLSSDGTVLLDGSGEPVRFYCPRADPFDADVKTDLFALGCTIYLIMMGYSVFPDIVDGEDGWYEQRFEKQQFPQDSHACSAITWKCWLKEYESAEELLRDIEVVEKGLRTGPAT